VNQCPPTPLYFPLYPPCVVSYESVALLVAAEKKKRKKTKKQQSIKKNEKENTENCMKKK
jgi:hypothetical protein